MDLLIVLLIALPLGAGLGYFLRGDSSSDADRTDDNDSDGGGSDGDDGGD